MDPLSALKAWSAVNFRHETAVFHALERKRAVGIVILFQLVQMFAAVCDFTFYIIFIYP